jgi:hypothetical protein
MADEIRTPALLYIQETNLPSGFLPTDNVDESVLAAIRKYSEDFPRDTYGAITGDETSVYDISAASITGWDETDSIVSHVYAPWSLADKNEVANNEWSIEDDPTTGKNLVFTELAPDATETIRILFGGLYEESGIPSRHLSSVAKLAASNMCRMIAARFAQQGESTIAADTFQSTTHADQWRSLAGDLESQYKKGVGMSTNGSGPEAASVEFAVDPESHYGMGKLSGWPGD